MRKIVSRYIVLLALLLVLPGSSAACGGTIGGEKVTFAQLFANPNQYNGKVITLEGFYFSGFEVQVLSESLEPSGYAGGHLIPTGRMIWVEGGIPQEIYDQLNRQSQMGPEERFGKISIEGKFEYGGSYGHVGAYDSRITPAEVKLLTWSPPGAPAAGEYSLPGLKYILLDSFDDVFWCDPDFYPVGRLEGEEQSAREQFPDIKANEAEFSAILERLALPDKTDYNDEEKLLIYREHKKLSYQVQVAQSGSVFQFTLRVREGDGERIDGTITPSGEIKVLKREPSFNTCPICLTEGTLIDTPNGQIPVERLREGMPVWTYDNAGNRIAGLVLKTAQTPVPSSFRVVKVILSDGRAVIASPGHPTAEERPLGSYTAGDILDGAVVEAVEYLDYEGATYDILPSGGTGLYRANGILLKSTLRK